MLYWIHERAVYSLNGFEGMSSLVGYEVNNAGGWSKEGMTHPFHRQF